MASDAALRLLEDRYQATANALAARTSEQVATLWANLGGVNDTAMARFSAAAAQVVEASKRQAVALADGYVRTYIALAESSGVPASTIDVAAIAAEARAGVSALDVYRRPVVTARAALANGRSFADALRLARVRATSAANTDVHLASRAGADASMRANGVEHYRRVPDATACTFCLVASTQRYRTGQLMPLHAHCGCSVAPLVGTRDRVVDQALLGRLKAASDRPDYWNDRKIAVHHHGELGPVLTRAGDHFTGPAGLAA